MTRTPGAIREDARLLIVRLGAVGDVIRTLPAVSLLKDSFPQARIAWLVEDLSWSLLQGHPDLDEVIRLPRRTLSAAAVRPWRLPGLLREIAGTLRARRFDVAADFQGSLKSALLAKLSGAPRRTGFARGHGRELSWRLMTETVRPPTTRLNRVERNLLLAESLGAFSDTIQVRLPERPGDAEAAERLLAGRVPAGTRAVVLSPGTSGRQAWKRWPAARFGMLAAALGRDSGIAPLVAWGPGEEPMAREVAAASGGAAILLPPVDLRLLAALLRRISLFVGADTGPMHLAWAVGCPVLALFGPTDPALNAPIGTEHVVLRRGPSMESLPFAAVLEAAVALLRRARPGWRPAGGPVFPRRGLPIASVAATEGAPATAAS
jgi:lipopolysaccharide heptosyltransferase I